ncbi:hypothetical protein ACFUYE_15055 [Micromonospora humida]|uniref:hypothetical protein n=1 Tax=Micromonospora humida TaxID=2809018 RepID=UPI00366B654D
MSTKNNAAKRLAREFNLSHAEAVGILREDVEFTEELFDELELSMDQARAMVVADYPLARKRADEQGISFRRALAQIRDEQARQRRFGNAAASFPTVKQLLRKALVGACDDLTDEAVHRDGEDNYEVHGLDFDGVDLPYYVEAVEIDVATPDLDTMIWDQAAKLEGETYIGTVEVHAEASFAGFMHQGDTYAHEDEITVLKSDWNDRTSYVSFRRQVILEFKATVIPGAESVELEFISATADELPVDPHSIVG